MSEKFAYLLLIAVMCGLVGVGILIDCGQRGKQTKWMDACLQEQRDEGYNHERAKRRCMMRWIEVEKASQ